MYEVKAPTPHGQIYAAHPEVREQPSVFLAGSIEMGKAEGWQQLVAKALADEPGVIWNPRRDYWDDSWVQDISNAQFREQVEWELDAMERADVIAMYFDPATKSPITLLELGLHARPAEGEGVPRCSKLIVACPEGFWRRGNVEIVARRFGVPFVVTKEGLVAEIRKACAERRRRRQP